MKQKYLKYRVFILLSLLFVGIGGCNKDLSLLDVPPTGSLTDQSTFSSEANADLFLNDIYNQLPDMQGETQLSDQYTDNSDCGAAWESGQSYLRAGSLGPIAIQNDNARSGPAKMWDWEQNYTNIRKCNVFLAGVAGNPSAFSAAWTAKRIAEVKFMRGLFYTFLFTNFGGLPLIDKVLNTNSGDTSDLFYPRSTIPETLAFIESNFDQAAADLPLSPENKGRATKGAALTVKAWADLFAASPLVNTTNDPTAWAKAAAANKAVMDLGVYSLFYDKDSVNGNSLYDLFLAENNWNVETIVARGYTPPSKGSSREGRQGPVKGSFSSAWGNMAPTQSLVDEFGMDNGKLITDPTSGYDPQHPYKNREPRFYQSILYDGAPWKGDTINTELNANPNTDNPIDLGATSDISNTGYYGKKTLDERLNANESFGVAPGKGNYIFYRYAEVLLSYAEAQNEASGPDASVYDAVNQIRKRGNIPPLNPGLSQDQMRDIIRHERRIEFAFEDKRWFDIRRWKITTGPNGVLLHDTYGMVITGTAPNLIYTPTPIWKNNIFYDYQNWVPIPQVDIDKNTKLVQNPGYN